MTGDTTINPLHQPGSIIDPLTGIAREGAPQMLAAEVDENAPVGGEMIVTYQIDVAILDPAMGYDWRNWSTIKSLFDGLMGYEPGTTTLRNALAFLFISFDMAVIERVADRVMVMRLGQVVEEGARDAVLRNPGHAYTRRLLSAVPVPDPTRKPPDRIAVETLGSPIWPKGQQPERLHLAEVAEGHRVAI